MDGCINSTKSFFIQITISESGLKALDVHHHPSIPAAQHNRRYFGSRLRNLNACPKSVLSLNPLDLNLALLFEHDVLLLSPFFEAICRPESVFHELHVCNFLLFVDLAPDREWADAHLPQGPRAIGESAKDRYIFSNAKQRLDLKAFLGPYPIDSGKGIDDSLRAG